jgi:hypothetical protein
MPIYKGSTEVTSGNLHKGSTEVQDGYKAADSFYVNETTLTIVFIDNTATGANFSGSTIIRTGVPGSSWNMAGASRVDRTSTAYRLSAISSSTANDSGNNVTITNSGSTYFPALGEFYFSGTIPTTSKTVTVTIDASTVALASRNLVFGSPNTGSPTAEYNWVSFSTLTWSGGGNASLSMSGQPACVPPACYPPGMGWTYQLDGIANGSIVSGPCGGSASQTIPLPSGFAISVRAFSCSQYSPASASPTINVYLPENSTHQSASSSISFTWN